MSFFNLPLLQMPFEQISIGLAKTLPVVMTGVLGMGVMSLGSCSTTPEGNSYVSSDASPEGKLFGDYLAGTYANHVDDAKARALYFERAFALSPNDTRMGRRAVTSAVTVADFDKALTLAKKVNSEPMSVAVIGAHDFKLGHYTAAQDKLSIDTPDLTVLILAKIMRGWAQAGAGDVAAARTTFTALPGGAYFSKFGQLQIAELELAQGDFAAALKALDELKAQDAGTLELEMVLARARVLAAQNKTAEALKYLEDYSDENGSFETGPVPAFIQTLKSGGALQGARTAQQNASRALTESSYGFFVAARAFEVAEVFLRFATELDPEYDKARMWTGELLAYAKRDDEALAMFRSVRESSPYWVSSKLSESLFFSAREQDDKALAVLETLDAKQPSFVTRGALGRAYLIQEDYEKALPYYEAIKARPDEPIFARRRLYRNQAVGRSQS